LALLYYAGLRISEVRNLRWQDLDFERVDFERVDFERVDFERDLIHIKQTKGEKEGLFFYIRN